MVESTIESNPSGGAESNENSYGRVFEYASALGPTVRELSGSGAYSALGGVVTFGRGLRSLRRGETGRGLWRLAVGGLFVAIAVAQRRSSKRRSGEDDTREEDYTDVVGGGSDIEDVSDGIDTDDRAGRDDAPDPTEVAETGSDFEDVSDGIDTDDRAGRDDAPDPAEVAEIDPDIEDVETGSNTSREETNTGEESDGSAPETRLD